MIKVEGLTKRYARTVAVNNISFSVEKGQIVGFLGPNGAGKTTTMRVLTCFLPPTAGTAHVAGFDVLEQPLEVKKRIGYLPETPPLYPEMEVGEYLNFVGRLKGVSGGDIARRVDEVCGLCAIGDVQGEADRQAVERLPAARRPGAGHHPQPRRPDPRRAHRGPRSQADHRDARADQGPAAGDHTIILSTHILPEVEQTCEHVVIINKGKLVATDTVENLTHRLRGAESVAVEVEGRDGSARRRGGAAAPGAGGRRQPRGPQDRARRPVPVRSGKPAEAGHPRRSGARRGRGRLEPQRAPPAWR